MPLFEFLIQNTLNIDIEFYVTMHIGFIAVAVMFFGLYRMKDYLKERFTNVTDYILSEIAGGKIKEKDIKKTEIGIAIKKLWSTRGQNKILKNVDIISRSLFVLLLFSLFSLFVLGLYDIFPLNSLALLVIILSLISVSLILYAGFKFREIYSYDPYEEVLNFLRELENSQNYPLLVRLLKEK